MITAESAIFGSAALAVSTVTWRRKRSADCAREIRGGWQEHSFTNLMCWAGLERLERIKRAGYLGSFALDVAASPLLLRPHVENRPTFAVFLEPR